MRYRISAQSQASVPPAPGLIETIALAESCLPLIIACSSKPRTASTRDRLRRSAPASSDGSSSASSASALTSLIALVEFLVRLEQRVERLLGLDGLLGLLLVVPEVGLALHVRSLSRSLSLAAMSKRVPQLGEPGAQVVGPASQVRVHAGSLRKIAYAANGVAAYSTDRSHKAVRAQANAYACEQRPQCPTESGESSYGSSTWPASRESRS